MHGPQGLTEGPQLLGGQADCLGTLAVDEGVEHDAMPVGSLQRGPQLACSRAKRTQNVRDAEVDQGPRHTQAGLEHGAEADLQEILDSVDRDGPVDGCPHVEADRQVFDRGDAEAVVRGEGRGYRALIQPRILAQHTVLLRRQNPAISLPGGHDVRAERRTSISINVAGSRNDLSRDGDSLFRQPR